MSTTRELLLSAPVRDGVGLGLAAGSSGLAFGATAAAAGLSPVQTSVLSLLAFSGASQFALVGVIGAGGSLAAGVAGALLLGARNSLYGLDLADRLGWHGWRTPLMAQVVIDETTAVAQAQPDRSRARVGFLATAATTFLTWNLASVAGVLAAGRIADTDAFGLDAVGPAVFLALLWSRLRSSRRDRWVAAGGAGVALATTPLLPPGVPVLLAATAALLVLAAPRGGAGRS